MEDNISTNKQLAIVRCTATPPFFFTIDSILLNDPLGLLRGLL